MRKLALLALFAAFTPWASAQGFGAATHFSSGMRPGPSSANGNSAVLRWPSGREFSRRGQLPYLLYPFGPYADYSYDAVYEPGVPSAAQPPVIVLQVPIKNAESNESEDRRQPTQALLIELQGDRYVRVSDGNSSATLKENRDDETSIIAVNSAPTNSPTIHSTSARETHPDLPALLIFRDGHREEIRDYTIADGTIYVRGDFYTDGYWNKKIPLTSLDLKATVKSNTARNVRFTLPSAPNEVITRP